MNLCAFHATVPIQGMESRVVSVNLHPSSKTKSNPSKLQAPLDSTATARKACVWVIVAYFDLLAAVAAQFAASPAPYYSCFETLITHNSKNPSPPSIT